MAEKLTIESALDSKIYVKQNGGGVAFKSPHDYLQPFVDLITPYTKDLRVEGSAKVENANDDGEKSTNVAYGRMLVEAHLPEQYIDLDHSQVVGILYALDTQKPTLKVYTGMSAHACTNLSIFNAEHVFEASLLNNTDIVYEKLNRYLDSLTEGREQWKKQVEHLMNTTYNMKQLDEKIGYMLKKSIKANFTTGIISAAKDLYSNKSVYAVKGETTTAWNVLAATTQYITDKTDIAVKPDATLFAGGLFAPELKSLSLN